ncbi:hypothetical protein TNIN_326901 [Trichonephila inaurata madagascariensis]|uniref:Uncharacterized protein n=1 Tax=Trichonephila inaurata madagascariensis TaxID=2747483 RepID=A0A8X6M5W6_9ARAC|nr:hypothetical protein TNIN_211751 [Trichonephila inaurata madagascariensis]GFY71770.1 hypothetical protein TNIN_326901 [Trichonephila inaurata madagascariensis]
MSTYKTNDQNSSIVDLTASLPIIGYLLHQDKSKVIIKRNTAANMHGAALLWYHCRMWRRSCEVRSNILNDLHVTKTEACSQVLMVFALSG